MTGTCVITTAAEIVFGIGGNAQAFQGEGWSHPEDGFTWSLGRRSVLRITPQPGEGQLLLELLLKPMRHEPYIGSQRVGVSVNGTKLADVAAYDDCALGFRLPPALSNGGPLEITLDLPDAVVPLELRISRDDRLLGVRMREVMLYWVPPEPEVTPRSRPPLPIGLRDSRQKMSEVVRFLTGLDAEQLMMQFESLGHNCEFGLVQRETGAEPLSLLRFVSMDVPNLLRGLDFGFDGVDDPDLTRMYQVGEGDPLWMARNDRYDMHGHTFRTVSQIGHDEILKQQLETMAFKRERFLDVLETGQKLFVFQAPPRMTPVHAVPLLNMLRSHGPNALLFVTPSYGPPGSVDMLGHGLFRGNIDRLAPADSTGDFSFVPWLSICANAYRMWREAGFGVAAT